MRPAPKPSLFSPYGQRRLGPDLLQYLRVAESLGDAEASAELGTAYADANGVEFDLARAVQHFQKGSQAGHAFCQFRLAEHSFHSAHAGNPQGTAALKESYDQIWAAAKSGVGEAYVALHFLHQQFRQSPVGHPSWARREVESALALFQTALRSCYAYLDGGSADKCINALEMLARDGFAHAYWTAALVAEQGCRDQARSQTNLRAAVENGVPAAINHFMTHMDDFPTSVREALLKVAAEHGHAKAAYLCLIEAKARGASDDVAAAQLLRILSEAPRWFSDDSLSSLEFICLQARNLTDLPVARPAADRVLKVMVSLGRPNAVAILHSETFAQDMGDLLVQTDRMEIEDQVRLAKDIGKVFVAALNGSGPAWKSMMIMHLSGILSGHGGIIRPGPHAQGAATAGLLSGLISEKLTGEECVPDFVRNGFMSRGQRGLPESFVQHALKEVGQIKRHRAAVNLTHQYGHGYLPSARLMHECASRTNACLSYGYPGRPLPSPLRPNWPGSAHPLSRPVSRSPFTAGWIHPQGAQDPLCVSLRRHLASGEIEAARRCLRFDDGLIPRLLTLAAGVYEQGYKLEAAELLAYGVFNLHGQAGLSHHMLAWIYHETGRSADAVRIASDCFQACECHASSDTDVIEYNLLLAEMLMSLHRQVEAEAVLGRLKKHAPYDQATIERCGQITARRPYDPAEWLLNNKCGDTFVHFDATDSNNPSIRATSLSLSNMDRYRGLFASLG